MEESKTITHIKNKDFKNINNTDSTENSKEQENNEDIEQLIFSCGERYNIMKISTNTYKIVPLEENDIYVNEGNLDSMVKYIYDLFNDCNHFSIYKLTYKEDKKTIYKYEYDPIYVCKSRDNIIPLINTLKECYDRFEPYGCDKIINILHSTTLSNYLYIHPLARYKEDMLLINSINVYINTPAVLPQHILHEIFKYVVKNPDTSLYLKIVVYNIIILNIYINNAKK